VAVNVTNGMSTDASGLILDVTDATNNVVAQIPLGTIPAKSSTTATLPVLSAAQGNYGLHLEDPQGAIAWQVTQTASLWLGQQCTSDATLL
jgi:hypothetical protein